MNVFNSFKFNNISSSGIALYQIGQPLLFALYSDNETLPIFVTISDETPDSKIKSITNLELCKIIENDRIINVIDLAPFTRAFFKDKEEMLDTDTVSTLIKKLKISATNGNESLDIYGYFIKQGAGIGANPQLVNNASWAVQIRGEAEGLYRSDRLINDLSDLILPDDINMTIVQPIVCFYDDNTLTVDTRISGIHVSAESFPIYKRMQDGTQIKLYDRNIIRKKFCPEHTVMLSYLNKYGYFEYFVFDSHYINNMEVEHKERYYTVLHNNRLNSEGAIQGGSIQQTITAKALIHSKTEQNKFIDLITSNRVYLYKNIFGNVSGSGSDENWIEVDISATPVLHSKKYNYTDKVSVDIILKNNYIY